MAATESEGGTDDQPNRYERRRIRTRTRLINAARQVFSEKGIEACTIHDITEAADVGRGSFYNFFDTKDELVATIVDEHVDLMLKMVSGAVTRYGEAAMALTAVLRYALEIELSNPTVTRFTVQTQGVGGDFFRKFHDVTFELVERGRATGVFTVASSELGVVSIASLMLGTLQAILIGRLPSDSTDVIVEASLRLLGMTRSRIKALMAVQLPSLEVVSG